MVAILAILHQDFWLWNNDTLIFEFMPIGLVYHAFYSILCAGVWGFAVKFAWPSDIETFVEEEDLTNYKATKP